MMRLIRFLVALLCVAAGVVIGALNPQPVSIDLGFTSLPSTLGVCLLVALLLGALVGGLVLAVSVLLPMRQKLKRSGNRRNNPATTPSSGES